MSDSTEPRTHLRIARSATSQGASPILLATVSHLAALDRDDLARLGANTECQLLRPGHIIYRQGDRAEDVFILLDGDVMLGHRSAAGDLRTGRQDFCTYGTFGDHLLLGDSVRYYTATSVSVSLLLKLPSHLLEEVLSYHPQIRTDWTNEILLRLDRQCCALRNGAEASASRSIQWSSSSACAAETRWHRSRGEEVPA